MNVPSRGELIWSNEVSKELMDLSRKFPERWDKAVQEIPFGDLGYGRALFDWNAKGRPLPAWFSYAPGQRECPALLEFRKELTEKFGLEILTCAEGELRRRAEPRISTTRVHDWGTWN